jgi:nucleotide-binding universal stress UspA family protein
MKLYKKILIALDTSEQSWHVFLEALKLVQEKGTWAVVVTVAPVYLGDLGLTIIDDVHDKIYAPYEKLMKRVQEVLNEKNITAKCVLEEGEEPFEKIVDAAYAFNCDLIIMGRSGSKLKTFFLGNTTARVIGYSPVDVLVIPYPKNVGFKKILVAVDGSPFAEKAFSKALALAKEHQSQLFIISVVDIPMEIYAVAPEIGEKALEKRKTYIETLVKKANEEEVKAEGFLRQGLADEKIIEVAKEIEAELLVMGTYGRTGIKRLLMGGITERVLSIGALPVLVVK